MSTEVRFRRGTTAEHATFTGAIGEVTVDTDKNTVIVHDGSTAGGWPLGDFTVSDTDTVDMTLSEAKDVSAVAKYQMSITKDSSGLKLAGDAASPGNNYFYGTDESGTKGFKTLNVVEDATPELGGEMDCGEHTIGFTEKDNGDSGTSKTIDWKVSNHQKVTLTGDCTFTFTAPSNPCCLTLKIVQDATGSRARTLPTIKWPNSTAPSWSTGANEIDVLSLYYDGSVYYGQAGLKFG